MYCQSARVLRTFQKSKADAIQHIGRWTDYGNFLQEKRQDFNRVVDPGDQEQQGDDDVGHLGAAFREEQG